MSETTREPVQRWRMVVREDGGRAIADENGPWVEFADYQRIVAERDALMQNVLARMQLAHAMELKKLRAWYSDTCKKIVEEV